MADLKLTRLDSNPAIGLLTFDCEGKKANVMTTALRDELYQIVQDLQKSKDLKALLIESAKPGIFIAGADINEIRNISTTEDGEAKARSGQVMMDAIEDLPFPTVALIDGACLGGGLEFSLACTWRFASFDPSVKIGLPEVNLGIIPGFGGTWRLPRVAGLQKGLGFIVQGKVMDSKAAYRGGLVDGLFPSQILRQSAVEHLERTKFTKSRPFAKATKLPDKIMEGTPFGKSTVASTATKMTLKLTKGKYPAPIRAIEVVVANYGAPRDAAMKREAVEFGKLVKLGQHRTMIQVFNLTEKYKKESWTPAAPLAVHKCAVLGAGVMGGGIAQLLSSGSIPVRLKDVSHAALQLGLKSSAAVYKKAVERRKYNKAEAASLQGLILPTLDYSGFKTCDLVIEAVVENMEVKKKVFAELDKVTRPDAVLASNTSSLSVTEMATAVKDPGRVVGMHFFNPVDKMPLVEIIRGEKTSDAAVATIVALSRKLRKTPIVVKDAPGFLVNRLLMPYLNEAAYLAEAGYSVEATDQTLLDFGMPMGAFILLDEIGLDVAYKVGKILEDAFGARMKACGLSHKLVDAKFLGKKNGKGFYVHADKAPRTLNPELSKHTAAGSRTLPDAAVIERCLYVMVNEAAFCLQEGVCREASDVDLGMMMGTGFPPFSGGLLRWADSIGAAAIVQTLERLQKEVDAERFRPAKLLEDLARKGQGFHAA
jgi:3-hydroxyacyl-CoA dehydrogenase/enoyl-CoA hydratase/3-hydroxybutyryl-CoA epimerase